MRAAAEERAAQAAAYEAAEQERIAQLQEQQAALAAEAKRLALEAQQVGYVSVRGPVNSSAGACCPAAIASPDSRFPCS